MRKIDPRDLADAAAILRGEEVEDNTAASRAASWLDAYAEDMIVRRKAREAGCTVKYMRRLLRSGN